jgi:hypothetical protein
MKSYSLVVKVIMWSRLTNGQRRQALLGMKSLVESAHVYSGGISDFTQVVFSARDA